MWHPQLIQISIERMRKATSPYFLSNQSFLVQFLSAPRNPVTADKNLVEYLMESENGYNLVPKGFY